MTETSKYLMLMAEKISPTKN